MTKSPAIVGVIPARFGSTRFPGKPLALISGKSLIQRTYENALQCQTLDEVLVATDDTRIYDHVREFGGNVTMTSETCPTGTDRLAEVIGRDERYQGTQVVVNIQGDEPFFDHAIIKKAVDSLQQDATAVMATAAAPLDPDLVADTNIVKCVMALNGDALYFSRSPIPGNHAGQTNKNTVYHKHIGLYLFKRDFLLTYGSLSPTPLQLAEDLEQLKVLEHGYRIKVIVVDYVNFEVNVPEDIKKIEKQLCKQNTFS